MELCPADRGTGGCMQIVYPLGNKCLDIPDGRSDSGLRPQIWDCSDTNENQMFSLFPYDDNTVEIRAKRSNKCFDIGPPHNTAGSQLFQWVSAQLGLAGVASSGFAFGAWTC